MTADRVIGQQVQRRTQTRKSLIGGFSFYYAASALRGTKRIMPTGIYDSPNRRGGQKGRSGKYPKSPEHRRKIAETLKRKGCRPPLNRKLGAEHPMFGKHHTEETKEKISKNNARYFLGKEKPKGFGGKGEEHPRWIKDRSLVKGRHNRSLHDPDMKRWRKEVYARDGFKCRIANQDCAGRLEAHHILSWKEHPELRYEANNGISLCHFHHPRKRIDEKRLAPLFQNLVQSKA